MTAGLDMRPSAVVARALPAVRRTRRASSSRYSGWSPTAPWDTGSCERRVPQDHRGIRDVSCPGSSGPNAVMSPGAGSLRSGHGLATASPPGTGPARTTSGRLGAVEDVHGERCEFTVELSCGPVHHFLVAVLVDEGLPLADVDATAIEWATAQDDVRLRVVEEPWLFAHASMQPSGTVGREGTSAERATSPASRTPAQ